MARTRTKGAKAGNIGTVEGRSGMATCTTDPHWIAITPGTALGYFKGARDRSWWVRQRVGNRYVKQRIGTADDGGVKADGEVVLTHKQAVAKAISLQLEERKPQPRHYGDGMTMGKAVSNYLEQRQSTPGGRFNRVMPDSTAAMSRQAWKLHGASIADKLVTAMDAKTMRAWHAGIAKTAPRTRGRALPFDQSDPEQSRSRKATANRLLTIAKAALSWARKHDALPDDMPDWWRNVSPFGLGDDPVPRMMDTSEITRLLNAAPADLRTLLQGALMTGCRYSEVRKLRARDYDHENGVITIRQSKTYKVLHQPLTPEGVALFDRLTDGRPGDALIFTRADGSPWEQKDAIRPMRAAVEAAKLDDVSFKTTRATYGKLLLQATMDIELVAKALGHSDSRITRKHYAQYLPSELARGIAKLPSLGFNTDNKVSRIGKKRQGKV